MSFATNSIESPAGSRAYLAGSAGDIVSGAISHQGSLAQDAIGTRETHALRLETIDSRLQEEYGVDVNEEMARLLELQNAYAANARVISIVQDLLKSLMAI